MAPVLPTPEELAKFFHEKYERLALEMGYETRAESRHAWENVPEKNRALMIATAKEVLSWIGFGIDKTLLEVDPETATHPEQKRAPTKLAWYKTWALPADERRAACDAVIYEIVNKLNDLDPPTMDYASLDALLQLQYFMTRTLAPVQIKIVGHLKKDVREMIDKADPPVDGCEEFEKTVLKMASESVKEAMDVATVAWRAGVAAYIDGKGKDANPVRAEGSDAETARLAWEAGWNAGKADLDHRLLTIGGVDSSFTYYPPVQNVAALPENAEEHDARWVESEGEPYVYSAKRGAWESAKDHVEADESEARSG